MATIPVALVGLVVALVHGEITTLLVMVVPMVPMAKTPPVMMARLLVEKARELQQENLVKAVEIYMPVLVAALGIAVATIPVALVALVAMVVAAMVAVKILVPMELPTPVAVVEVAENQRRLEMLDQLAVPASQSSAITEGRLHSDFRYGKLRG